MFIKGKKWRKQEGKGLVYNQQALFKGQKEARTKQSRSCCWAAPAHGGCGSPAEQESYSREGGRTQSREFQTFLRQMCL